MNRFPMFGAADLTNCDREPIHLAGSIQPHGAFLALDPAGLLVRHAAGATAGLLGAAPEALLGQPAATLLPADILAALAEAMAQPADQGPNVLRWEKAGESIDIIAHAGCGLVMLEFEKLVEPEPANPLAIVQALMLRSQRGSGVAGFHQAVAEAVHRLTGFDRVMIYRFDTDGAGEVVAEARVPEIEGFLGLRYPASDVPRQARALYLRNWVRIIPDARYAPAPILATQADAAPLDLSGSVLRSVSPLHLEYLRNMGVVASLSFSVIVQGRLWGLIACHHRAPRFLPYRTRAIGEVFAQFASAQLEIRLATETLEAKLQAVRVHAALVNQMSRESDLAAGLTRFQPNLLDYIPADGVGLWFDGHYTSLGAAPGLAAATKLVGWLNENATEGVFHTDRLPLICPALAGDAAVASGLIALSVSKTARDYVLWFRRERVRTVTWAGNPAKPVEVTADGMRLTPRRSFAAWCETVRGHAAPWQEHEVDAAKSLRVSLMEVVLLRIDQLAHEREKALIRQGIMSVELDHRLEQWQAAAEQLQVEARRRAAAEAELSQVLRRTVDAQEEERRRIARELHDTAGQSLTLLQFSLDDLGLQPAIRSLLETLAERTELQFDAELELGDQRLNPAVETALYRVLQESLTNVMRHAEATRVTISLAKAEGAVRLAVKDDGLGFDPAQLASSRLAGTRLGLLGTRERMAQVGGTLEVASHSGQGTRLTATVPR